MFWNWNPIENLFRVDKSEYRLRMVMTNLLFDLLKCDSLQVRREKARLTMFYRATNGLMDIPLPDDLSPMVLKNTRNYHPKKFRPVACNTNYYMGTFPPSIVKLWNSLPSNVLDQPNITRFKAELEQCY